MATIEKAGRLRFAWAMSRHSFETPITVTLTGKEGRSMTCSALLERDVSHLTWNRMTLLGGQADMRNAIRLFGDEVTWTQHHNPAWPGETGDPIWAVSGKAFFRSVGMAGGVAIAEESLQKFANLEIIEHAERMSGSNWGAPSAEYWFLQRPSYWPSHGLTPKRQSTLDEKSPWAEMREENLKLRMITHGHLRDDVRLSDEIELLLLPGIEIRPITPMEADAFEALADDLWFRLRILITFCWRQYTSPLSERRVRLDGFSHTWHTIAIRPRERGARNEHHVFSGSRLNYLARGAIALARYRDEAERLHAAVYGYAQSFKATSTETALTNCVEAIERLISVIEIDRNLDREVIDKKRWRSMSKALRKGLSELALTRAEASAIGRSLAGQPTLSLQERIERVVVGQGKRWTTEDEVVLSGLQDMIKLRNDIVHGRLASDPTGLHVEVARSRAIFEGLFLNLLLVRGLDRSSSAASLIFQFETARDRSHNG